MPLCNEESLMLQRRYGPLYLPIWWLYHFWLAAVSPWHQSQCISRWVREAGTWKWRSALSVRPFSNSLILELWVAQNLLICSSYRRLLHWQIDEAHGSYCSLFWLGCRLHNHLLPIFGQEFKLARQKWYLHQNLTQSSPCIQGNSSHRSLQCAQASLVECFCNCWDYSHRHSDHLRATTRQCHL